VIAERPESLPDGVARGGAHVHSLPA